MSRVYVAEASTLQDAVTIAQGASHGGRAGSAVLGVAAGRLRAVVVAACSVYEQPSFENAETMARFQPRLSTLLV
jgi:hypothetical protein